MRVVFIIIMLFSGVALSSTTGNLESNKDSTSNVELKQDGKIVSTFIESSYKKVKKVMKRTSLAGQGIIIISITLLLAWCLFQKWVIYLIIGIVGLSTLVFSIACIVQFYVLDGIVSLVIGLIIFKILFDIDSNTSVFEEKVQPE